MRFIACLVLLSMAASAVADSTLPAVSRLAFGSCADEDEPQPIWDGILEQDPDVFVFLGDNVYADTSSPQEMRAAYDKLASVPGYAKLRERVPVEAIWDDHDYGENDAGREYAMKQESRDIFLEFFGEPESSPRRQHEGIYAVREFGPPERRIQLILLDTRYFRSPWEKSLLPWQRYKPAEDASLTMLGEEQWQWLEAQLRKPARLRLIASGIQIINDEHGYETWGNFPHERRRLFDLIRDTGAAGTILLSGDRHFAEIAELDAGAGYPLLELTASGMTHAWDDGAESRHSHRLTAYGGLNFGMIEVDWQADVPQVTVSIHDVDGAPVASVSRALDALQPRRAAVP